MSNEADPMNLRLNPSTIFSVRFLKSATAIFCHVCLFHSAFAQTAPIERVKPTDAGLSCAQIQSEAAEMDGVIAQANADEEQGKLKATAGTAGNVAAEVGARTGLFGNVGGLAGAIFGKALATAAANSTQESGNNAAQQASERAKSAAARKESLTALLQSKGCNPNGTASAARAAPLPAETVAYSAAAPTSAEIRLPDLNPNQWFSGSTWGTFGENIVNVVKRSDRIVVAGFRVVFVTHNEAYAITRGTYMPGGLETGTARAKMVVDLQGVDDATLQAITDAAYERFIGQLRAAGREVVLSDQFQPALASFKTSQAAQEVTKEREPVKGRAFTPKGLPLWWDPADQWGDAAFLSQTNNKAVNELSRSANAISVAPVIVVDFARMQSSGNRAGYGSSSAEVGSRLSMSVSTFSSRIVRAEEVRGGGVSKGDDGYVRLSNRIDTEAQFADMQKVEENNSGSVLSLLGAIGSKSTTSINRARTSNEAYSRAANAVLTQSTGTFAKFLAASATAN